MRTLFIVNSLATTNPTAKGALAVKLVDGFVTDLTNVRAMVKGKDFFIDLLNSLGNGSVKQFSLNPFNSQFVSETSGATSNVAPKYNITYPTGNARVDSGTNQFQGGIVVKEFDKDKNVWNTKKILNVEVIGSGSYVANSDVVTEFKAQMATITGAGKYVTSASHTSTTASEFNLLNNEIYIELVGDLRWFKLTRTNGMIYINSGVEVAKLERELAPNSGFQINEMETETFASSNFIADASAEYNMVVIKTLADAERPLLPNAAGLPKTLYVAFKKDGGAIDTIFANFKKFMTQICNNPTKIGA